MRLLEAILDANHRAVAGDPNAGLHPADYQDELPVIALTCIDPRLNALFPNVLGVPADQFIWLRNAGNIITGPLTSTMRSLALACAVKEGREIAIIGHTDCHVRQTTALQLMEKLQRLGVDRSQLPENLNEFFGMFASEQQNVIKSCAFARQSPLIGPKIPVHGLLVDIQTGKLDWIVNGYETWQAQPKAGPVDLGKSSSAAIGALGALTSFDLGEMKFPVGKIGDGAAAQNWGEIKPMRVNLPSPAPQVEPPPVIPTTPSKVPPPPPSDWVRPGAPVPPRVPGKKPLPPPIRPRFVSRDPKR
jgi:carbonic anhydrase